MSLVSESPPACLSVCLSAWSLHCSQQNHIGFETIVVSYGTDIASLKGDHKRYLYGPGEIAVAHSDHEHLTVADLADAVEGYKKLILHALKH